jgi:hypothetical protein
VRTPLRIADRLLEGAARALLEWSADRAQPSQATWVEAVRGELDIVDGGFARLRWALGGVSLVCRTRRRSMTRSWHSWPALLRTGSFGLALGAFLLVLVVWSNVVVPSHESDDEYGAWYLVLYGGLLLYFVTAGVLAARDSDPVVAGAWSGAAAAVVGMGIAMLTFIVVDNLFLDVVMQQPDKLSGFLHSGLTSQRDYVNQGLLMGLLVALPVLGIVGAGCGALGGVIRKRLGQRRAGA